MDAAHWSDDGVAAWNTARASGPGDREHAAAHGSERRDPAGEILAHGSRGTAAGVAGNRMVRAAAAGAHPSPDCRAAAKAGAAGLAGGVHALVNGLAARFARDPGE